MSEPDKRNLFVVDLETTGTNPFLHEVLSVGIAPLDPNAEPRVFYVDCDPDSSAWTSFAKANFKKFEFEWRLGARSPARVCGDIQSYLESICGGSATAVGHNIGFDMAFLRKLAFRGERTDLCGFSHRALDTHTMLYLLNLKGVIPASALTSDGAFQHFGISVPEADRHTALGDVIATRMLALQLIQLFSATHARGPARVANAF
jgi:DNA polymerase-3 subunit epsilon